MLTVEATPDAMRGRVLGAQNTVMLAAPALTSAPLAAVAATAGLPVAGAVLAALAGVPLARRPADWTGGPDPVPKQSCDSPRRHHAPSTRRCGVMAGTRSTKRLRPVRRRDLLHRVLHTIALPSPRADLLDHTVEIDTGREQATTDQPGSFPVRGGTIAVSVGLHGVQRIHNRVLDVDTTWTDL